MCRNVRPSADLDVASRRVSTDPATSRQLFPGQANEIRAAKRRGGERFAAVTVQLAVELTGDSALNRGWGARSGSTIRTSSSLGATSKNILAWWDPQIEPR